MHEEKVKKPPCVIHPERLADSHIQLGPFSVAICEDCFRKVRGGLKLRDLLGAINHDTSNSS